MKHCNKCGIEMEEGVKFCPACGAYVGAENENTQSAPENDFSAKMAALNDTPDTTAEFDAKDIEQNKVMAILSYFGLLVLIPLFAAKGSKFARFHANQGLILMLASIAWSIAYSILSSIILAISYKLYFITTILSIVSLVFLVLAVIGIVNAAGGKAKELPIIGKFKILK